jgi:hypothetical protein
MCYRNAFWVALALLLTGFSACAYNPSVHPDKLKCRDNNGCPSGYLCVGATDIALGFCCNNNACLVPPDGAAPDARPMDALADSIILVGSDGSSPQDLSSGLDLWQALDLGVTDSTGTQAPDSILPGFDVASDLAGVTPADAVADAIVSGDAISSPDLSNPSEVGQAPDLNVTDSMGTPTPDLIPPRFDVLPSFDVDRRDTIPLDVVSDGDSGGLGRADVALTCVQQIKNNNYSWGAVACSQCVENSTPMEAACKSMIDCLANKSWPCSGTCWTDCSNSIAADAFVNACASTLTNAACPHD